VRLEAWPAGALVGEERARRLVHELLDSLVALACEQDDLDDDEHDADGEDGKTELPAEGENADQETASNADNPEGGPRQETALEHN